MKKQKTLFVNIAPTEFLDRLQRKIELYNSEKQPYLFSSPPFIDYSCIRISGNKLVIEKANKLLDGTSSPNYSYWGFIYVEIKEDNNGSKLIATFDPSTAMQDFVSIVFIIGFSMMALPFLILESSWLYTLLILLGGGIIFIVVKSSQERYSENFESYLNRLITDVLKAT